MPKLNNETILLAFAVVTGLAVLLQTIMLLAILVAVRKAANSLRKEAENLRSLVTPVLYDTRDFLTSTQGILTSTQEFLVSAQGILTRITPKVEVAVAELAEIAHGLRTQTSEMQSAILAIVERVKKQSDRLDGIFSNVLDTVDRAGGFVAETVSKPVRQLSNIVGSFKAIVESLRTSGAQPR
jgi:uncharacterized protein YoxC